MVNDTMSFGLLQKWSVGLATLIPSALYKQLS